MYSVKAWCRKGSGSIFGLEFVDREPGDCEPGVREREAARYFSFQRSRSLSELESLSEIEDDMRSDSNPSLGGELRSWPV